MTQHLFFLQKGVHYGILQGFKHMKNGGVVVNVSSTAGLTCIGDMNASPTYVASKHAVNALTRTFGVSNMPKIDGFKNPSLDICVFCGTLQRSE